MEKSISLSPLAFAAKAFSAVCEEVDGAMTLTERIKSMFADAHEELQYRVDKRIALERWIKIQQEAAVEAVDYYTAHYHRLSLALEAFKAQVKADLEFAPDVEFRGKIGKIWLQNNPPSVEYTFGGKHVTPDMCVMFGVDMDYVIVRKIPEHYEYEIDGAKVEAELKAGKKIPWASMREGKYVRFPVVRKAKTDKVEGGDDA